MLERDKNNQNSMRNSSKEFKNDHYSSEEDSFVRFSGDCDLHDETWEVEDESRKLYVL